MTRVIVEFRRLFWCIFWSSLVVADGCGDGALVGRDDDDDDGDNCSSSLSHHSHTPTTSFTSGSFASQGSATTSTTAQMTRQSGVGKGGIAGIVLGIILGLLLLSLLLLFLWYRKRQHRTQLREPGAITGFTSTFYNQKKERPPNSSVMGQVPRSYTAIPPSPNTLPSLDTSTVPLVASVTVRQHEHAVATSSHSHSSSVSSLPNPHEEESSHLQDIRNRELPPTPGTSDFCNPEEQHTFITLSATSSPPPSTFDLLTVLTRGPTSSTTTSRTSMLHSEMAAYQKRLEAHHEKEMQVRDDVGGSSVPLEPPPEYREQLSATSTSDLGEASHVAEMH